MASISKFLLLLLCSYLTHVAHAADDRRHKVLSVGSLNSAPACSEAKVTPSSTGVTVPLHHRHGPCSPVPSNKTQGPTMEERLRRDQLRAAYIKRKFSGAKQGRGGAGNVEQSDDAATVPTTLGTSLDTMQYVVTVGIGSPAVTQAMFIDTGGDVSWVHCKPCSPCNSGANSLFDPSASSTYSAYSCSSAVCGQLNRDNQGNGCSSSQCQYSVKYHDGSSTSGTYSSDVLTVGSTALNGFQFGCSHSEVEASGPSRIEGLMGLSRGAQSLASQTGGIFGNGNAFSYCLPATPDSSGFLTLGAETSGYGIVKTQMLRISPSFYGVQLEAIFVGGKKLDVPTSVFSAGTVMDSGTIITRLPPTAYAALSSAFKAGMTQHPPAPPASILDTCFDFSGHSSVSIPAVALVFSGGAVVTLAFEGIMQEISDSVSCLAFAPNSDDSSLGFIGNVQQRTFEVLYDIGGGTVGFREGAC